jgi:hypothetical protein
MRKCKLLCASLVVALLGGSVRGACAQTFESVGVRAQGMAGAFVAVADDATASWWNPAGLASGAYLSAVIEGGRTTKPRNPPPHGPAARDGFGDFAIAFPALGLSYYHLRISEIAAPGSTAAGAELRQDPGAGTSVRSVAVNQFSSTVGQSIGEHLVIGSTVKLLRAGAVDDSVNGSAPLDEADALDVPQYTRGDLDMGVMANFGRVRLGLAVKNITEPSFGDEGTDRLTLQRQARVGLALLSVPNGALQGFTVAADADLTSTPTAVGEVRHVAAGLEGWIAKGRVGLRAGVSANTVGELRPAASVGASIALTHAFHVNASAIAGRDESVTGWSTSVSVAF